jgi:hypothetical protein
VRFGVALVLSLLVGVLLLAAHHDHQSAYCQGYEDAWLASSDPYLNWQEVDGCSGS